MCFLILWSLIVIFGIVFGCRYINRKRDESVKEFKKRHGIKL